MIVNGPVSTTIYHIETEKPSKFRINNVILKTKTLNKEGNLYFIVCFMCPINLFFFQVLLICKKSTKNIPFKMYVLFRVVDISLNLFV